jgi:hypothetical protein
VEIKGLYHDQILMEIKSDRRGEFGRRRAEGELCVEEEQTREKMCRGEARPNETTVHLMRQLLAAVRDGEERCGLPIGSGFERRGTAPRERDHSRPGGAASLVAGVGALDGVATQP